MITWLRNLRIRLVGGSLLTRTVVTVAAFTMTTCLFLGLFSMAAVGATRAIVGGGDAPPADGDVAAESAPDGDAADGEAADRTSTPSSKAAARSKGSSKSGKALGTSKAKGSTASRRPGGAVAPADALRAAGAGDDEEGGS